MWGPILFILGLSALFYFFIIIPMIAFFEKVAHDFIALFTPKVIFYLFCGLGVIAILFVIYIYTRIVIKIKERSDEKKERQSHIEDLESRISQTLKMNLEYLKSSELKAFIHKTRELYDFSIEYGELDEFTSSLSKMLKKARKTIEIAEFSERISKLHEEEHDAKERLEELDRKIYLRQIAEQEKTRQMLERMNTYDHSVFPRDKLNEKQVAALMENDYFKVNEHCILERKIKCFLVNPSSNHSKTHTFLVWNVKELLKRMGGVENIREHESVDADLTFKYKSKSYALEIETGTLLGKKDQTQDKIDFLNQKYPNRWFFIVSNKTLLPKYNKLGPTTQRNGVLEKLQKMLK